MIVKTLIIMERKEHAKPVIQIDVTQRDLNTSTKKELEITKKLTNF